MRVKMLADVSIGDGGNMFERGKEYDVSQQQYSIMKNNCVLLNKRGEEIKTPEQEPEYKEAKKVENKMVSPEEIETKKRGRPARR